MKTSLFSLRGSGLALTAVAFALTGSAGAENSPIPFSQIGAKATADYHGDAFAVTATADGARLRCGFQKLEGRATAEGLWVESTTPSGGRLRLVATAVGREVLECGSPLPLSGAADSFQSARGLAHSTTLSRWCQGLSDSWPLPASFDLPSLAPSGGEGRGLSCPSFASIWWRNCCGTQHRTR
jgi:hypothetical protein